MVALGPEALTTATTVRGDLRGPFENVPNVDARLERMIMAVSQEFQRFCNRKFFAVTNEVEDHESNGAQLVRIEHAPVTAVTSVQKLDDFGTVVDTLLGVRVYRDGASGLIFRRSGFLQGSTFEAAIDPRVQINPTPVRLRVTYSGGWTTPGQVEIDATANPPGSLTRSPETYELEDLCIAEVTSRFQNRGRNRDVENETTEGASTTFRTGGRLLPITMAALKRFWLERMSP